MERERAEAHAIAKATSAFPRKRTSSRSSRYVRFVPEPDSDNGSSARGLCGRAHSRWRQTEDPRVTKFVQDVSARGGVIACICRGSMLAARSKVVAGRRMTGFNDSVSYPELVVQPDAEAAAATWVQDAPVVVDRNLVTSPHPRHSAAFSAAIVEALRGK